MASETPPCMVSTTIRTTNTPASASIGQLIPPAVTAPRCHVVPPPASRSWACGDGGGAVCGGDVGSGDGGGGDVGSCEVGTSSWGVDAGSGLWTGLPQLQQNLASGSNLLPQ